MEPFSLVHLTSCLVSAMLGAAVLARGPGERTHQLVGALCLCCAHWCLCETIWNNLDDPAWVARTIRLSGFGWLPLGPLLLHLVVEVQDDRGSLARRAVPWAYAGAGASAALYAATPLGLAAAVPSDWGWSYRFGPLFPALCAPVVVWAVWGLARWQALLPPDAPALERRQARSALVGIALVLGAALVTDVLLPALRVSAPRLGSASIVVFAGIVTHGMTRNDYFVLAPAVFAERILQGLWEGAALVRGGGRIAVANEGLGRLVGVPPETLEGMPLGELLSSLDAREVEELRGVETQLRSVSGRWVPVSVSSTVLRDRADEPIGQVFAVRDLRGTVAMRQRIVTAGRLAAVGELAAGVVHEIASPIAFMRANLAELRRLWDRLSARGSPAPSGPAAAALAEGDELIDESVEGVERIARLVESVRSFSHAGLGRRELADVNALLEDAVQMAGPKLRHRGADLQVRYGDLPLVPCAPQELRQLFLNLLLNAAGAVGAGGAVRLHSAARLDAVRVEVADDGCGIAPERVERLFDPVFGPDTRAGGLGIGLPACYEIVRKHGGELRVRSEEGRGTRFIVELPVDVA